MREDTPGNRSSHAIPVVTEEATVRKEQVESGRVRIDKTVETRECVLAEWLREESVVVERVARGTAVDPAQVPPIRQEGDITIIPVMEEVLVVEKRLMLKEELHVRRVVRDVPTHVPVTLRQERVTVERQAPEASGASDDT